MCGEIMGPNWRCKCMNETADERKRRLNIEERLHLETMIDTEMIKHVGEYGDLSTRDVVEVLRRVADRWESRC